MSMMPNSRTLELWPDRTPEGGGVSYAITRRVAGPGSHTLPLDGHRTGGPAGSSLADTYPAVNDPYRVAGAAARACHTE